MTTGFNILRSSDAGAPTLNGTAGSMIGVLDALLEIGGSAPYWEKVFTGTNKAAYRALNGERYYLRVDDSAAQYAAVRGFATMSDVDTGTGQFPNNTQQTNWNWFKSNTADSTARTYLAICTDRFMLILVSGGWSGGGQDLYFFGEPKKTNTADTGSTVLSAYPGTSMGTSGFLIGQQLSLQSINNGYATPGNNQRSMLPFAKSADGSSAAAAGIFHGINPSTSFAFASYGFVQPWPVWCGSAVSSTNGYPRACLPHIFYTWFCGNDANLTTGDTFTDADGATYQICHPGGTNALGTTYPLMAIMTSDSETGTV